MKKSALFIALAILTLASCQPNRLLRSEKKLIGAGHADSAMYVLSVFNIEDSLVLRERSRPVQNPQNKHIRLLEQRMLTTVMHPNSLGVGIAAPQVGISRQMILVQRFDKEGEPFETYYNPLILSGSEETVTRHEGCLSIPGWRGPVERPDVIQIKYINHTGKEVMETVQGFTARIFQHEIDHLNGIFYTDLVYPADSIRRVE